MKGYKKTHAIAYCCDCNWECEDFERAPERARKHNLRTGHKVSIELGLHKTFKNKR